MLNAQQTETAHESVRTPKTLIPYWPEEARSIKQAGGMAKRSDGTIRAYCQNYPFIGRKVTPGGWQVSIVAFQMYLDGDYRALALYHSGDRSSPEVVRYYERFGLGHLVKGGAR